MLSMCSVLGNREENQLPATSYNLINKQGVRDGSMGYNKRTRFSKKSLLNQYFEYFIFVHVFLNASFAHVAGRQGVNLKLMLCEQHLPSYSTSSGAFPLLHCKQRKCKDLSEISQNKTAMLTCGGSTCLNSQLQVWRQGGRG